MLRFSLQNLVGRRVQDRTLCVKLFHVAPSLAVHPSFHQFSAQLDQPLLDFPCPRFAVVLEWRQDLNYGAHQLAASAVDNYTEALRGRAGNHKLKNVDGSQELLYGNIGEPSLEVERYCLEEVGKEPVEGDTSALWNVRYRATWDGAEQLGPSEQRSDEVAAPYLVVKSAHTRTSVQPPPPLP